MTGTPTLFGVETEYALTGVRLVEDAATELISIARETLSWLSGGSLNDLYLANGSRLYLDCGGHPEVATAECTSPDEIVRHVRAGDAILEALASAYRERHPESRIRAQRCNVDYTSGTTWGVHESYLCRKPPRALQDDLVPHLVTRIVYTGAGGFDPRHPGLRFVLSPRSLLFRRTGSLDSTVDRGIFHRRDEDHCDSRFHRLHVILGESLCSARALRLKLGATALVVAMSEMGLHPGGKVALESPITALRAVSRDPALRTSLPLVNGHRATAVEIQRHYLEQAEAIGGRGFLPSWAPGICAEWRQCLDALERGPGESDPLLDWQLKRILMQNHAERNGFDATTIRRWSRLAAVLDADQGAGSVPRCGRSGMRFREGESIPPGPDPLHGNGESRRFQIFCREMFELDTRFGQLGEEGIAETLARSGLLEMKAPPAASPHGDARECPPRGSRARVRGDVIARHSGDTSFLCTWEQVLDQRSGRLLDLRNPFESEERWTPPVSPRREHPLHPRRRRPPAGMLDLFTWAQEPESDQ